MRAFRRVLFGALICTAVFMMSGSRVHARFAVGQISGHVQDAATSTPLPFVNVFVSDANGNSVPGVSGFTDIAGDYTTSGTLPDGTYFIRTGNAAHYINQAGGGQQCVFSCNVILSTPVVMLGGATAPVNFSLSLGGTLTGTVTNESATGLASVSVSVVDAGNQAVGSGFTDGSGGYTTLEGIPTGSYYVRTSITNFTPAPSQGYINELYNNVPCLVNVCPLTSGTPVAVTAGLTTPNINFALHAGARFAGRVTGTDAPGGIANVTVQALNTAGQGVSIAITDVSGNYETGAGLPAGSYTLRTIGSGGHINKFNDGTLCVGSFCGTNTVTPIAVADGALQPGVDFVLDPGAVFSGTVTEQGTGDPLGTVVTVLGTNGASIAQAQANFSTGAYAVADGLPPGTYFLRTQSFDGHIDQLYTGTPCTPTCSVNLGTPQVVVAPGTLSGRDFSLAKGGRVSGTITSTVGGAKLGGVQVSIVTASGVFVSSGQTNGNGSYLSQQGLADGTYFLRTSNQRGFINEVFPNINCLGTNCPNNVGMPIIITGANSVVEDMDLAPGGRISGFVKEGGVGVPGASVSILDASGNTVNNGTVDAIGNYISAAGLTNGSYFVRTLNSVGDIDQLYNGQPCGSTCNLAAGTAVAVTSPNTTPNINFNLIQGGRIAGTITSGATPLAGITVQAFNPLTLSTVSTTTDSDGNYVLRGLQNGTYYARTTNSQGYINEAYDNIQCGVTCGSTTLGNPLVISTLNTIAGVNFDLTAGGRIAGTVTDQLTATPIANMNISILDPSGASLATATTDLFGHYVTGSGLSTGNYFVRTSSTTGYINELWNNVPCPGTCTLAAGNAVAVTLGATVNSIDFALGQGGRVAGTVTDSVTFAPLPGVSVQVFDSAGRSITTGITDAGGNYVSAAGLPTGAYFLRTTNNLGYDDELYDNMPCPTSCSVLTGTPVGVTIGSTTTGKDFELASGGRISGRVIDGGTFQPLAGVNVTIFDSTGRAVSSGNTNAFGNYTTGSGLKSGTYFARTSNGLGYINQLYNGLPCIANCIVTSGLGIVVTSPGTTGNVNFALQAGGRIAGTITAAIGGAPLSGVTVQVYNASNQVLTAGSTNSAGQYVTTGGLTTGDYFIRTFNGRGLINQLYNGHACSGTCDVTTGNSVHVTLGSTTNGIDFSMADGARFSGTVTKNDGFGSPAAGVIIEIYDASNAHVASGLTDGSGFYTTSEGVASGSYFARTQNSLVLVNKIWNNISCASSCTATTGTPIPVTAPNTVAGIDFLLDPDADADADGILNTIDAQPAVFSNDFSDLPQGGTTSGTIASRDTWSVSVFDVSPGGVQMQISGSGSGPVNVDVCPTGGSERVSLDVAGEAAQVSCAPVTGTTTVRAVVASPTIELRDPPTGPGLLVQLTTGQGASIGSPVVASPTNTDPITVLIIGAGNTSIGSFDLDPGESVDVTVHPDNSVDATVLVGEVTITVGSNTETVSQGDSHTFTPPGFNYTFSGFFSPISNPPVVNKAKAGSAVPITFGLGGNQGMDIFVPGSPTSQQVGCANGVPTGSIETIDTPGKSGLEYDSSSQRYTYTWKTVRSWTNTCRQLSVQLKDGSTHTALFQFK